MALTAAQLLVKIGADTSDAEQGMSRVSRSLQSFGADAMKAGGVLSAAVTAPLALMGKSAVQAATDLDREMRNIQSISKQTDTEIAALSDTFVRMSMDASITTDSAVKLAAGFYDIQGSGFAGAAAMQVLEASTKAASAGLTDTDVAAKAITATLNAYGYGADQATRVSDVLFKTMDIGVVTFDELAQNLGDIVGTAAIAGVSIEELGAAYATMTKAGIGAAESSTALNQLMLSFISPSKQAAEMAATLGIDLSAAALQSKGLGGAMADLTERVGLHKIVMTGADEATKAQIKSIDQQVRALQAQKDALGPATKANKEQRDAIQAQIKALQRQKAELRDSIDTNVDYNLVLTTMAERAGVTVEQMSALFPNVRALKAALSLTRGEMGPFAEDLETIAGASGATEAAFAIQAKSFAAQMKTFSNTLEGLKISIGQIVLPILTELMNRIKPLLDRFMNLDDGTKRIIVTLAVVAAAAGPVLLAIGAISMVLGALLSPVGLVVAAVAALGVAFATNFLGIRDMATQVFGWIVTQVESAWPTIQATITTAIQTIQNIVTTVLTAVQEFWHQHGDEILTFAQTVWGAIQQFVDLAVRNIADIISTVMTTVRTFWDENGQQIMEAARIVWDRIWQIISTVMQIIQAVWQDHGEQILHIAQNIWDNIKAVIETVINVILGIIKLVTSLIRGDWQGAWEAVKGIAESIWDGIYRIISNLLDSIKTAISIALDFVRPLWERVWNGIKETTQNIWDGIVRAVKGAINSIIEGVNSLIRAWNKLELRIPGFGVDIPKIDIPGVGTVGGGHLGWPGLTIGTPDIPTIPLLAAGGLVTRPTLAMLGEQGPEAVVPLRDTTLDTLAERIAEAIARRPMFTINANYRYQDERSLRDDLRLLQMLGAAT